MEIGGGGIGYLSLSLDGSRMTSGRKSDLQFLSDRLFCLKCRQNIVEISIERFDIVSLLAASIWSKQEARESLRHMYCMMMYISFKFAWFWRDGGLEWGGGRQLYIPGEAAERDFS